jgi:CRISPR type III-B/RAMP module RAMP protein Cmr6
VVKAVLKTGAVAQRLNPSLLLDRCPQRSHVDHSKIAKGRESEQGQHVHLQHVKDALVKSWPRKEDYQQLLAHLEGGIPPVLNTLQARLALHLSRAGGLENANICLHPVHGIPYIPGSGLKGLAHAYACHLFHAKEEAGRMDKDDAPDPGGETGAWRDDDEREAFIRAVEDIFGWAPNRERSGPATTDWSPCAGRIGGGDADAHDGIAQHRGLVAFHDAFGEDPQTGLPPRLELDVCTPHYGAYYRGESPPGDWLSPVPVTFLTIAAGSRFRFRVGKADPVVCSEELFNAAKRLLLGGLHWLGAGAKTAAGYGWFSDDWQEDPALEERKRQQEEATRRNALLERYRGLEPDQVLFLPDQANDRSRSGRIIGPGEAGATWRSLAKAKFKDNFKKNNWKKGQMLIARRSPEGHLEGPVEVLDLPIPPLESA